MTPREWVDRFADDNDEPLKVMDGYDDCIIGIGQQFNRYFVVYDTDKIVQRLVNDGMSMEDAEEWFCVNQVGAYVGENTPAFLLKPPPGGMDA